MAQCIQTGALSLSCPPSGATLQKEPGGGSQLIGTAGFCNIMGGAIVVPDQANFSLSADPPTIDCIDVANGSVSFTFTLTDGGSGATTTCVVNVNVTDGGPSAICNTSINFNTSDNPFEVSDIDNGSNACTAIADRAISVNGGSFVTSASLCPGDVVTLRITDSNGVTATCAEAINVTDNVPPIPVCTPLDITLDSDGEANISAFVFGATSTDDCDTNPLRRITSTDLGVTSPSANTSVDCSDLGPSGISVNTVTLIVTDDAGNTSTCINTVTIRDNIVPAPSLTCQAFTASVFDPSNSSVTVSATDLVDVTPSACTVVTFEVDGGTQTDEKMFTCLDVGTKTATIEITYPSGITETCTTVLTIEDASISSPACTDQTVSINGGPGIFSSGTTIDVDVDDLFTGDWGNCSTVTYAVPVGSNPNTPDVMHTFGCMDLGAVTATIQIVRQNGTSETCDITLTVVDASDVGATCIAPTTTVLPSSGTIDIGVNDLLTAAPSVCDVVDYSRDGGTTYNPTQTFNCADVTASPVDLMVRFTDANGVTSTCTTTITLLDNIAPTNFVCTNTTVALDAATCNADVNPFSILTNCPTEACGIDMFMVDYDFPSASGTLNMAGCPVTDPVPATIPVDINDIGTFAVTMTISDVNGNVSVCTASITIEDSTAPTITACPTDVLLMTSSVTGTCPTNTTIDLADIDYVENCAGSVTLTVTFSDGSPVPAVTPTNFVVTGTVPVGTGTLVVPTATFAIGQTNVQYELVDAAGNATVCTYTVTLEDDIAPTVTNCPADVTLNTIAGGCENTHVWEVPGFVDACLVGNATTTVTVEDESGAPISVVTNISSGLCSDQIGFDNLFDFGQFSLDLNGGNNGGVTDNTPTSITLVENDDDIDGDNGLDVAFSITVPFDGVISFSYDYDNGGQFSIFGTVFTSGAGDFSYSLDGSVTTIATSANVSGLITVPVTAGQQFSFNQEGDGGAVFGFPIFGRLNSESSTIISNFEFQCITANQAFATFPEGVNTVTYDFTNDKGNTGTCSFTVTVEDNVPPVIEVLANQTLLLSDVNCSAPVYPDYAALLNLSDNCGAVTSTQTPGVGDPIPSLVDGATTTVTIEAADNSGNTSTSTFIVTIDDNVAPVAQNCPANQVIQLSDDMDASTCGVDATIVAPTFDDCGDGSGLAPMTVVRSDGMPATATFPIGNTTVTYTYVDAGGNTGTCETTISVTDNEPPVIMGATTTTVAADPAACGAVVNFSVTAMDCVTSTITFSQNSGTFFPVGTTVVSVVATDAFGNERNTTFDVIVTDDEDPTVSLGDQTLTLGSLDCNAPVYPDYTGLATSDDNCGVTAISQSPPAGSAVLMLMDGATQTVTIEVEDASGNVGSTSFTVTIDDNVDPVAVDCPTNQVLQLPDDGDASTCMVMATWTPPTFDDCGDGNGQAATTSTHVPGDMFPVGNTVVTYTYTDKGGNSTDCSFTISVTDGEGPEFTAVPNDVTVDAAANCEAAVTYSPLAAAQDCDALAPTITYDIPSGSTFGIGTTVVTVTAEDSFGNLSTATFSVTIEDNEDPTIDPVADQTLVQSLIDCGNPQMPDYTALAVTDDNCGVAGVTQSPMVGSTILTAHNTVIPVTLTVEDIFGNTSSTSFNVTVEDDIAPVVSCNNITKQLGFGGTVTLDAADEAAIVGTSFDPCGGTFTFSISPSSFDCTDIGPNNAGVTVIDGAGNVATCTVIIEIEDNTNPTFTCPSDVTVDTELGACNGLIPDFISGITPNDDCGIVSVTQVPAAGSTFGGAHGDVSVVTITVEDNNGNFITCNVNVTLNDNEEPFLSCPVTPAPLSANANCMMMIPDLTGTITTSDNCTDAGSLTIIQTPAGGTMVGLGTTDVTITVTDAQGNTNTCMIPVTVIDDTDPVAVGCPVDVTVNVTPGFCGAVFTYSAPTFDDNCDGTGNAGTLTSGFVSGSVFPVGTTDVIYEYTDAAGNGPITCEFSVTVIENQAPVVDCNDSFFDDQTILMGAADCNGTVPDLTTGAPFTDDCGIASITQSPSAGSLFGSADGDMITVTITATDLSGNTATCTVNLTLEDEVAPVFNNCPNDITVTANPSTCTGTPVFADPIATDNCGGTTVVQTSTGLTSGVPAPTGIYMVSFMATDAAGNTAMCSFTVTIEDSQLPTIVCPADVTVDTGPGVCTAMVTGIAPVSAFDNCPSATVTYELSGATVFSGNSDASNNVFNVGTTLVTYTITDAGGRQAQCAFNVTVEDNEAPAIQACTGNISQSNDAGVCGAVINYAVPTFNDNCDGVVFGTLVSGLAPGSTFPLGVTTVTYRYTDASGNVSLDCSFTVTVNDTEAPVIVCPGAQVLDAACPSSTVPDFRSLAVVTDNCPGPFTIAQSPAAGTTLSAVPGLTPADAETFTVTLTATDANGVVGASCTFQVTLNDNDEPIPSTPSPLPDLGPGVFYPNGIGGDINNGLVTQGNPSSCGTLTLVPPTARDCNGNLIYAIATISGATYAANGGTPADPPTYTIPAGTTVVIWIYDDGNGNQTTQIQNITVENDTYAPNLTCPADITLNTSDDGSGDCLVTPNTVSGVSTSMTVGTEGTVIPIPTPMAGMVNDNCDVASISYQITDSSGGFVASNSTTGNTMDAGSVALTGGDTYTVTYFVQDAEGNISNCSFTITVVDDEMPSLITNNFNVFTGTGGDDIAGDCGYTLGAADISRDPSSLMDNCGVDNVTYTVMGLTTGTSFTAGSSASSLAGSTFDISGTSSGMGQFTITWTIADVNGNTASFSRLITVTDNETPEITCVDEDATTPGNQAARTISADGTDGDCIYTVQGSEFDPTVTDNCDASPSITNNFNGSNTLSGANLPIGTTSVIWTTTDDQGNTTACAIDITVTDDEAPVFSFCPQDLFPGTATVVNDTIILPNVTSDCSQLLDWTRPILADLSDCSPGSTTLTEIISDASVVASLATNFPYDPTVDTRFANAEFPVGVTRLEYLADDGSGNTASCVFWVKIEDTEAPNIVCPTPQSQGLICAADTVVDYRSIAIITDNCTDFTVTQMPAPGTPLSAVTFNSPFTGPVNGASFDVTITVQDDLDNQLSSSCTFAVTLNDTEAPVPDVNPLPTENGTCGVLTLTAPSSDDCGTLIYGVPNIGAFIPGSNPPQYQYVAGNFNVVWTYTDAAGNSTNQNQTINVTPDLTAPTVIAPNNIIVAATIGQCDVNGVGGMSMIQVASAANPNEYSDLCGNFGLSISYQLSGATTSGVTLGNDAGFETYNVGVTTVTYFVTDFAGNVGSDDFTVTVLDIELPTIDGVPNDTIVSCDNVPAPPVAGTVTAADNCGVNGLTFVQSSTQTGNPSNCGNYNYVITRSWTATDDNGNSFTDDQFITVQDTEAPSNAMFNSSLPGSGMIGTTTSSCSGSVTLQMTGLDDCAPFANITVTNDAFAQFGIGDGGLDASGNYPLGTHTVTFTATDPCGNTATFDHTFTVEDDDDPVAACASSISITLPPTGSVTLSPANVENGSTDNCGIVNAFVQRVDNGIFSAPIFDCSDADGNPKQLAYTVVDAAGNDATCFTTVIIQDTDAPVAVCQDITVNLDVNGEATITAADIDGGSTDACSGITSISASQTMFTNANIGNNSVLLTVTDLYGNEDVCAANVFVRFPEPCFTVQNTNGPSGAVINVPVTVDSFVNVQSFQMTLVMEHDTVGQFQGATNLNLGGTGFTANVISPDTLNISYFNNLIPNDPINLMDGDTAFFIQVLLTGPVIPSFSAVSIIDDPSQPLEVSTEYNGDFFVVRPCINNGFVVINNPSSLDVGGMVVTEDGNGVAQVDVTISSAGFNVGADQTDNNGDYIVNNVASAGNYLVTPEKDINWLNGVSAFDLALIQRHIVGIDSLDTPYQKIAADAFPDGRITTFDLVQLQTLLASLGTITPSANTSWVFADANQMLPDTVRLIVPGYDNTLTILNLQADSLNNNFIGIKVGDVDGDADPLNFNGDDTDFRGSGMDIRLDDQQTQADEIIEIAFTANDFNDLLAYEWILDFDADHLEFVGAVPGALPKLGDSNFGQMNVENGQLVMIWYDQEPATIQDGETLFTLQFRAQTSEMELSELLEVNADWRGYAYRSTGERLNLNLAFNTLDIDTEAYEFALYQNQPNPFKATTVIGFVLPEAGEATITVQDANGRLLKRFVGDYVQGYNEITLDRAEIPATGMMYYQLQAGDNVSTKKMILLE